ncbi:MAG: zf-HC2 domain-containing protein [Planctomycetota bacterium]
MKCDLVRDLLNVYLDDELPLDEANQVKTHLVDCLACRKELSELEKIKGLIEFLPRHSAPADLREKLEQNALSQAPVRISGPLWRHQWAIPLLATAATIILVIYVSLMAPLHYEPLQRKIPEEQLRLCKPTESEDAAFKKNKEDANQDKSEKKRDRLSEPLNSKKTGESISGGFTVGKAILSDKAQGSKAEPEGKAPVSPSSPPSYSSSIDAKEKDIARGGAADSPKQQKELEKAGDLDKKVFSGLILKTTACWYNESLENIIQDASSKKRLVLVYFYFSSRDYFPENRDDTLMRYSIERALFTRIFVPTDKSGKITDLTISELFNKNKLSHSAQCVVLDYYGNLIHKVISPIGTNKITAAIDEANKKVTDIESSLSKSYAKAEKLGAEGKIANKIKTLQDIIKTGYVGYESIKQARADLDALNQQAITAMNDIINEYIKVEEYDQDPDKAIKELELILQNYKGLSAEKELKEAIKQIKEGQLPNSK